MPDPRKIDLAYAYRILARLGLDDHTYTHLSVRAADPSCFYIYPFGKRFEEVTAESLLTVSQVDGIVGDERVGMLADWLAGVRVEVEAREVRAGNIEPDTVAGLEQVAGGRQRDAHLVDFARCHKRFLLEAIAVAAADDRVDQVHVVAAGVIRAGRIHVDQLGGEVAVKRR